MTVASDRGGATEILTGSSLASTCFFWVLEGSATLRVSH